MPPKKVIMISRKKIESAKPKIKAVGMTKAQMNAMSPLDLFGMLPHVAKSNVAKQVDLVINRPLGQWADNPNPRDINFNPMGHWDDADKWWSKNSGRVNYQNEYRSHPLNQREAKMRQYYSQHFTKGKKPSNSKLGGKDEGAKASYKRGEMFSGDTRGVYKVDRYN